MDRFIARANIRHFGDRLRSETDLGTRYRLQKLLVEEEDKLGQDLELIGEVERTISALDASIQSQASLVATFNGCEGDGFTKARSFLDGLVETHTLYKDYYRRLVNGVSARHA